jgi:chromate reductase, NAD(P)H dehydrogenase (quinone)
VDRPFRILGIAGSLRRASVNKGLLRAAQEVAPQGVEIEMYDLADIPFYNGDVEAAGIPQPVLDFVDAIRRADAVLIASPEYNYSYTAVLKNAIDWASRPSVKNAWKHKPIALMGASGGQFGTVRSQLHLRQVFASVIEAFVMLKPELMVNNASQKFDSDGNLTDDDTRERVEALVKALVAWAQRVKVEELVAAG